MGERPHAGERPSVFFWVVVTAAAFYLGVRLVQGIVWILDKLG